MQKIIVLGANGMLGYAVSRYFLSKPEYSVLCSARSECLHIPPKKMIDFCLESIQLPKTDYVINCIGLIKQRKSSGDEFFRVNTDFPPRLSKYCSENGIKLIHITTDCVFSGKKGNYVESDEHDAEDAYGKSKSAGEAIDCMRLRTSIIGPEISGKLSLFEFVRNASGNIHGYLNHFWNGVTTLQYAKICDQIIKNNFWDNKLYHIFSNSVSKYELVCKINEICNFNTSILMAHAMETIDRTLASQFSFCGSLELPSLDIQLEELNAYLR